MRSKPNWTFYKAASIQPTRSQLTQAQRSCSTKRNRENGSLLNQSTKVVFLILSRGVFVTRITCDLWPNNRA